MEDKIETKVLKIITEEAKIDFGKNLINHS